MPVALGLPTPKELAVATQAARESTWGMKYPPKRLAPLPGWIRVKFYSHIYKIRHEMLPDMEGEVMLHPNGGLDTRRVCRLWNLEQCAPVDPERWIPVERADPNWLSPLAIRVLSERNNCLLFIEPTPLSPSTAHKRAFREAAIHLQTSLYLFSSLSVSITSTTVSSCYDCTKRGSSVVLHGWDWLDKRTKFPELFRNIFFLVLWPLSWMIAKTQESAMGKYMESTSKSCRKRYRRTMQSYHVLWMKEQMHWFVLMLCMGIMAAGLFWLLGALDDARYQAMALLRQPSVLARAEASGGIVGGGSMGF
ncbi:hypothetical protein GYMLUDRAFT_244062 [Collybiopsis luxurians FD-317 M1]|uniref:Uncharacterized protein n=1 Tax=Collybiopsis luxurians FD-317 M1 TaxID=944289 RepID=A0A0D0CEF4_9AGAR|nr:hypothetical protein GYMLUDRAFT_244062 [Collybiopsis luxurians FD-317 M1]